MAIAPALRLRVDTPSECGALLDRAVGANGDDLPFVTGKVLCRIAGPPVPEGGEKVAVRGHDYPPADLLRPRPGRALEQNLLVGESFVRAVELGLHYPHLGGVLLADEIGKIDRAVAGIVGIDSEIN